MQRMSVEFRGREQCRRNSPTSDEYEGRVRRTKQATRRETNLLKRDKQGKENSS